MDLFDLSQRLASDQQFSISIRNNLEKTLIEAGIQLESDQVLALKHCLEQQPGLFIIGDDPDIEIIEPWH